MKKFACMCYLALSTLFMMSFDSNTKELLSTTDTVISLTEKPTYNKIAEVAGVEQTNGLDSAQVQAISDVAFNIGVGANGGKDLIPYIPNSILHVCTGLILGFILHLLRNRRKKKLLQNQQNQI